MESKPNSEIPKLTRCLVAWHVKDDGKLKTAEPSRAEPFVFRTIPKEGWIEAFSSWPKSHVQAERPGLSATG